MKLSEELKNCLDSDCCEECQYWQKETKLTCRGLLQAAYEEIKGYEELEKQCIEENSWCLRMLLHKWKKFIEDIYELYEYRKLEEQGKLLKLPCKVGDRVWTFEEWSSGELTGETVDFRVGKIEIAFDSDGKPYYLIDNMDFQLDCLGKTLFFAQEQAENALKELREREGKNG